MNPFFLPSSGLGLSLNSSDNPVYIIAGQSNALGQPPSSITSAITNYSYLDDVNSSIQVWYDNGTTASFEDFNVWNGSDFSNTRHYDYNPSGAKHGSFGTKVGLGPGEELVYRKHLASPSTTIYYLKNAYGGNEISEWDEGNDRWTELTTMLTDSKAAITAVGKTWNPKAFIWMQGESDSTSALASSYSTKLTSLITRLRALPEIPSNLRIILVRLNDNSDSSVACWCGNVNQGYVPTINSAMDSLASGDSNISVLNTDSYTLYDSNCLHYDTSEYIAIGNALNLITP